MFKYSETKVSTSQNVSTSRNAQGVGQMKHFWNIFKYNNNHALKLGYVYVKLDN